MESPIPTSPADSPSRPTAAQLRYQLDAPFALFLHLGINTFHGREWSDGSLPAESFNPTALDCRQWVRVAKDAGAAHVILTAKHHDGFCLWPTATKRYSVAASPWKNGQGDIVRELADACHDAGIGLGLYCSPWDRQDPDWANQPAAYDARYLEQLTELCSNYGELVELWLDGAGSEQHPYDWPRIMSVVRQLQPNAMIFNMGDPTIRWVGNEDGLATDPCWYTVDSVGKSIYDDAKVGLEGGDRYLPPECDVPIRRHWFWQPDDRATLKSIHHLEAIWYRSIGLGANLLLNVPPDRRGLLDDADVERLLAFRRVIGDRFAQPQVAALQPMGGEIVASWPEKVRFDHLVLREEIAQGQTIARHRVTDARTGRVLVDGVQTIGAQRVHAFPAVETDAIRIEVEGSAPLLSRVEAHLTGVEAIPALEAQPAFDQTKMG